MLLKYISPIKVTIYGLLVYLILLFSPFIEIKGELSFLPMLLIILSYLMFFMGLFFESKILSKLIYRKKTMIINTETISGLNSISQPYIIKAYKISLILSLIGIILKLIDRFLIRKLSLFFTIMVNREMASSYSNNIFAIAGSVIFMLCIVPFFLVHFIEDEKFNLKKNKLISFLVFLYYPFDGLLFGSRFPFFISLGIFIIYLLYLWHGKSIGKKLIYVALIIFLSINIFLYSSSIWLKRLSEMNINTKYTLFSSLYARYIPASDLVIRIMYNSNALTKQIIYSITNFVQYYIHGSFIFQDVFNFVSQTNNYSYGKYTFFIIYKFLLKLLGKDLDINKYAALYDPYPGIYKTFFGPLYIDFGWLILLFMFIFGIFVSIIYRKVRNGNVIYMPLYSFLVITIFSMPVVNLIQGTGTYLVVAYAIMLFIIKFSHPIKKKLTYD